MSARIVDLSHPITAGMVTYPGLPGPTITPYRTRAETAAMLADGVSYRMGRIELVANTGTYLDAPSHFDPAGVDLADLPLERLVGVETVVVRATGRPHVDVTLLPDRGGLWGRAVLVHTGWDRHWGTPAYGEGAPYLTADAVRALIDANVALVGIDSVNLDDVTDVTRPAHHGLLHAGIPILEHLTGLDRLPDTGARLTALPAPVRGLDTFPVRAVAVVS